MSVPTTAEHGEPQPSSVTTRGWMCCGLVVLVALVVAGMVVAAVAAHLIDRLLEWAWAVS